MTYIHKSVRLTARQAAKLQRLAAETRRSQSEILRLAVDRLWLNEAPDVDALSNEEAAWLDSALAEILRQPG